METVKIGSFNIQKFSKNADHERLKKLADIILSSGVDILAIQEVYAKVAIDNLLKYMGMNWKGKWESPDSKSASAAEGYGFIWNEQNVVLSRNRRGKVFEPTIHNQYPHKEFGTLIRNPFYGRFTLKRDEMCELRLINTHIMFSKSKSVNDSEDHEESTEGDISMRKKEFEVLASKILPKISNKDYDKIWGEEDEICRKPYTILLGDYNLNLRSSGAKGAILDDDLAFIIVRDERSEKQIITIQDQLSTLKKKNSETQKIEGYSNNFDHFTYDQTRPIETKSWVIDAPRDPQFFNGDFDEYKRLASDHLMIVMEISFT